MKLSRRTLLSTPLAVVAPVGELPDPSVKWCKVKAGDVISVGRIYDGGRRYTRLEEEFNGKRQRETFRFELERGERDE